jgi:hypothetical protein
MAEHPKFRRIVVGLSCHRPSPEAGMRLATEMARLLHLDVFGLFVQEESLFDVASLPFSREFKILGGGWRPFESGQLARELEAVASRAHRALNEAARNLQTACRFEVVRGSMVESIAAISSAEDIILLSEPAGAAEYSTQSFAVLNAAFRSAAAVLLVPRRIARSRGAIVAIAREPDDPSIAAARAIAVAAKEELIVVELFPSAAGGPTLTEYASPEARVRRLTATADGSKGAASIDSALRQVRERLIVMTRGDHEGSMAIATIRQVPILVIEPPRGRLKNGEPNSRSAA